MVVPFVKQRNEELQVGSTSAVDRASRVAEAPTPGPGRMQRADARRNRARVIEVAAEVFAAEGLSVSVQEIARRAGVGTGTVSRHFPTKRALVEAIVGTRAAHIVDQGRRLLGAEDPGQAFFEFFTLLVDAGVANRGLGDALAGAGIDAHEIATGSGHDVMDPLRDLLVRAQRAGAVRPDITPADVKAVFLGCIARERSRADAAARARMIAIARDGLRGAGTTGSA